MTNLTQPLGNNNAACLIKQSINTYPFMLKLLFFRRTILQFLMFTGTVTSVIISKKFWAAVSSITFTLADQLELVMHSAALFL